MCTSFSQLGEDRILWWLFHTRYKGFYVDVGCHDPYKYSNTALLHIARGWHGLNVDADERFIDAFKKARPGDTNVCAAIGGSIGQLELTIFDAGEINTLDPSRAQNPEWSNLIREQRMVDVLPLGHVLHKYVPPGQQIDFLNVDIEGLDYEALVSNDWDVFLPEVIAVEVNGFDPESPSTSPTFRLLKSKGYHLLAHFVATSIYQRSV